ncbi:putative piwi-domain-containing protein [Botrytis fragariae]|uniref:Putative piwi-domain-containing protein n=1 Tax=Botrytis fragariae TaxID=1964551 RepID=A0A8H6AMW5_9HELO|nr:putative piwi-domain-containing protein [Botrytis fragariae]KAF5870268.1 putative piwi-domain-containing protein [Botrytis fragariae]
MQLYVRNCALCKAGKSEHRRTEHCSLDPDINPYRRFDAERQCDFCTKDHEPHQCKESKANACSNCGHGWHDKRECMLDQSFDSHLEQFTLPKYRAASQVQKARPEIRREECREKYDQKFKKGRYAQSSPSMTLISTPSKSGPSEIETSASRSTKSNPPVPSLSAPSPAAPGSFINLSELNKSLPSQPSQSCQTSQASGRPQSQTQSQQSADEGAADQSEEKTDAEIRKENCEKWTEASLRLAGYPPDNQLPASGNSKIRANFLEVRITNPTIDLRRYRVEFGNMPNRDRDGNITSRSIVKSDLKRAMINQMLVANPPAAVYATDFFCYIISVGRLYPDCGDALGNTITKSHLLTPAGPALAPLSMSTSLVYEHNVNLAELRRFVNRAPGRDPNYHPGEDLKSLNIVSWQMIFPDTFQGGRLGNKFYPENAPFSTVRVLPPNNHQNGPKPLWDLCDGFFSSMRPGDGKLLLNLNCTTSAFFHQCLLEKWISTKFGTPLPLSTNVIRELRGVKKWTVTGIDAQPVGVKTFTDDNGRPITVWQHMTNTYPGHQQGCSPEAWCVNVGSIVLGQRQIWYPADMLKICWWQPAGKKAGIEITQQMLRLATKTPLVNQASLKNTAIPLLAYYHHLIITIVRQLAPPQLKFRSENPVRTAPNNPASWTLNDVANGRGFAVIGNPYRVLYLIYIDTKHRNQARETRATDFARVLCADLHRYGFSTGNNASFMESVPMSAIANPTVRRTAFSATLDGAVARLKQRGGGVDPPLVVVLLPNAKKGGADLYSDVKWWGDCISGIPTVCVSTDGVDRGARPDLGLMANIALKINFKLGGINHRIANIPLRDRTMIMGADVTHVGKGQDDACPSQAGVVATRDSNYVHYLASARLQPHNTEFIEDLQGMVEERLEAYHQYNGYLPAHILFYRDGVGEAQYGMVLEEELPQVRAACASLVAKYGEVSPLITLLVVGKRHHARFFPDNNKQPSRNLPSGTVVDRGVVDPNRTNFYLQSHDSALGTARTGHYVLIVDEIGYGLGQLETITNLICFTGSRATKGLSICTPAKYADILCTRLRCYMHPALHREMETTLTNATVTQYRQNSTIWNSAAGNPWHHNINNIMFYL